MTKTTLSILAAAALTVAPVAAFAEDPAPTDDAEAAVEEASAAEGGGGFMLEEEAPEEEVPLHTKREIEYTSHLELGVGYVSEDSFKHGEYTGLEDEGPYAIGNIDLSMRDAYDSEGADYLEVEGYNLGLESRFVEMRAGRQGRYGGYIGFDQIPKFITETARTPFINAGGTTQTLPPGWVASATTAGMTTLQSSLRQVDVDHDRKRINAGFHASPAKHWQFSANYQHEIKDGTKTLGAVIGDSGGNPRSVLLIEPIDYTTDQLDATIAYSTKKLQAQLSYYVSLFDDGNNSVTWEVPFLNPGGFLAWDNDAQFPTGLGRISTPPDNQFHQVNFSGGLNIDETTRATLDLSHGWMLQDEDFLGYTVNPLLNQSVTPLPRASLDGEIRTTLVNLEVTSRPMDKLHVKGGYRYDDRDNNTPVNQYNYIGGDAQDQTANPASDRFRFNRPYSYTQHELTADAEYEILPRTDFGLGYEYEKIDRTLSEVDDTHEHIGKARIHSRPTDYLTVRAEGSYGAREGDLYDFAAPLINGFSPEHVAGIPDRERWESHFLLRKFFEADRDRARITANATVTPVEWVSVGLAGRHMQDKYDDSPLGLQESDSSSVSLDISVVPVEDVVTYAYYTHERIRYDQTGWSFAGNAKDPQAFQPGRIWAVETEDRINTVGFGVEWKNIVPDTFDASLDFVHSRAEGRYEFSGGDLLIPGPAELPDLETTLNSVSLTGAYHVREDITVKLGYRYESYSTFDWALDGVASNTLANVITLGNISPDYAVHVVGGSVAFYY